jgi:DNA-binding NtrC family response regulator
LLRDLGGNHGKIAKISIGIKGQPNLEPETMLSSRPTILIVDDEPLIREGLRFAFELDDFDVLEAEGANEALHLMQTQTIDLVLSDVRMPEGSGRDLLQKAQAMGRPPSIILMTGFADLTHSEALRLGAAGLVSKPFDLVALVKLARQHLKAG